MSGLMTKLKKWLPTKRRLMQLYFALLFNVNFKGFSSGTIYQGASKQVCVPGINCYSCPGAVAACPLGSLQGSFSADHSTVFYVGGILLLYAVLFGRMICGWLCPFGLIQDLLYKLPTPKLKKGPVTRLLSLAKYVILSFFVLIVPITYAFRDTPLPAFCKYICPAGTLEGGLSLLANKVNAGYFSMLGPIFTWKFLVMVSILVATVFVFRVFCRFICPLGALYGLFNRLSVFGIRLDRSACVDCGKCFAVCKVDILHVGDRECISCGDCLSACPTGAISWKGPKILLRENEAAGRADPRAALQRRQRITRAVSAVVMLAVLAGAALFYWNADTGTVVPQGTQVGDRCYGYPLELVTGAGVSGETLDPTATGRVTVINFWGTWCTPCVNELPYFQLLAEEYADTVTVVAVHASLGKDTAPAYLAKYYPDSPILFAQDYETAESTGVYYATLGGRGTYPYTVVLDARGIITRVFLSSVTYADLQQAVTEALGQ